MAARFSDFSDLVLDLVLQELRRLRVNIESEERERYDLYLPGIVVATCKLPVYLYIS